MVIDRYPSSSKLTQELHCKIRIAFQPEVGKTKFQHFICGITAPISTVFTAMHRRFPMFSRKPLKARVQFVSMYVNHGR